MMIVINAGRQAQLVQPFVFTTQVIIAPAPGRAKRIAGVIFIAQNIACGQHNLVQQGVVAIKELGRGKRAAALAQRAVLIISIH